MIKRVLIAIFILPCFSGYSQNYIQQYPINGLIDSVGNQKRVIFSVFDSTFASYQYYFTPFYESNLLLKNNNGAFVSYNAMSNSSNDSVFGYITYDHILHQFAAVEDFYFDQNDPSATMFPNDAGIRYYMEQWQTGNRQTITSKYDLNQHNWITTGTLWDPDWSIGSPSMWSMAFQKSDLESGFGDQYIFDPAIAAYRSHTVGCFFGFTTPVYDYLKSDSGPCEQDGVFAYNSELHTWCTYSPTDPTYGWMYLGIFNAINTDAPFYHYFAYYDEQLNIWQTDTLFHPLNDSIRIKDRIVSFIDSTISGTKVHFLTYDLLTHSFKKDSVSAPGAYSLNIQNGTVSWNDINGTHIRGYDSSLGWGSYPTLIVPQFYLTDLYAQTGLPIIHVRNYTIGTDSIIFDFGDGTISVDNQHVLWHQYNGPGPYTVSVSSFSGGFSSSQTVSFPCLVTSNIQNSCNQLCSGSVEIVPPSTSASNSIFWSNGSTSFAIDSLCAGSYAYTFTDTSGCLVTDTIQVYEATVDLVTTTVGCQDLCSGSVSVAFSGGSGPITYLWNTGDTIPYILDACPGNYFLTITSGNQCIDTISTTLDSTFTMNATVTSPYCHNQYNGSSISINTSGGVPPFDYYWPDMGYSANPLLNEGDGTFELHLSDASGCIDTFYIVVPNPPQISITSQTTDPSCVGCTDGIIALTILNAIPSYNITWAPIVGNLSGDSIVNLPQGTYIIFVTDLNGCTRNHIDTLYQFVNLDESILTDFASISPNPATDYIEFSLNTQSNHDLTLQIFDALGKKVYNKEIYAVGTTRCTIDISSFSQGIYFIQLQSGESVSRGRFVKE